MGFSRFIPEAWSTCSVTCGVGSQVRLVKCQVLLSFSQSVADLPIDECEGPKPVSQRACYSGPCSGEATEYTPEETELLYGSLQEFDELYDWEYEGFTECSESCGGGVQEAVVTCLNKQTRETADETLCVTNRRPPQLLKACSLDPCPPRWEIGKWSTCSLTCGVGLQTRDVFCSHLLSRETNETVILADEFCYKPKPSLVQACNRFDCPPSWYPTEWQECSVSCGEGTQSRNAICRKMLKTGGSVIINSSLCPPLPFSSLIRPCALGTCARHNRPAHKQSPHIMAIKKVYIQTRKQKKLHFIVGGYAYLLPKTSVILRCPTRRFRKSMITWEKNDKRLVSSAHITIAPYGYMKIHRLKPSDTGTYTCTAGPAREHFVIKLIGSNKKIIAGQPTGIREEESMRKASLNEALRTQEKHINGILFNGSKAEKRGHLADPSSWYDDIISRLLQHRGWPGENLESWEAQESTERNASSEEDQSREYNLPFTMVTEQKRLDDIIRNLSQQPEELKDVYTEQLVVQLAHEVFKSHLEHQESVLKASRRRVDSASVEYPLHRHVSGFTSSLRTSSAEAFLPTSVDLANGLRRPHQKPAILRKISAAQQLSASEVVTHLGQTVVLASGTLSVLLHCEAVGNPKPTITWAKNGEEVKYNDSAEYRGTITSLVLLATLFLLQARVPNQDAIGFLGHLGTLLAHIQLAVNQHSQVLLCQAAFQPLFPKPVALHGVVVTQVQDPALGLVEPHTIGLSPLIQPVQIPLQSLPTIKQINTPAQLGVICKLTEGALNHLSQIIDKDIKQDWPQHRALGNTTCDQPPTGVNSIHHHSSGPAIQPVLYQAKSTPIQAMSSQFLQENAVGNRVKGFTEV
ncbi:hypothetical protein QYF61_017461 [Mycteria americana]|uniref:Ig-like domain-containing protein n=1 Tax=Mycteria americana TaxID=33587 RepID=A0AAN7RU35_MYCAM|nr:hypothetical protein QYF61_017461 [Mycteria americana]